MTEATEAFNYTKAFIKAAIADKAHLTKPGYINANNWVREKNIMGIYYASPIATMEDFARIYGFKNRERPSKIIETCLRHLYYNCSHETQREFNLSQLYSKKPNTLEQSLRRSRIRGGAMSKIVSLANEGRTAKEIHQAGHTLGAMARVRRRVAQWNTEVPYINRSHIDLPLLNQDLLKEEDPAEIKKLLARISLRFYITHTQGENPLLLTAKDLFSQAGIHYTRWATPTSVLMKPLEEADVPVPYGSVTKTVKSGAQRGPLIYYFILTRFKEPAIRILRTHSDLERFRVNPVVQVFGPPAGKYPSTTEFDSAQSSGDYASVNSLLAELGVGLAGGWGKTVEVILEDCSKVQIFNYPRAGKYVYNIKQRDALSRFILDKERVK